MPPPSPQDRFNISLSIIRIIIMRLASAAATTGVRRSAWPLRTDPTVPATGDTAGVHFGLPMTRLRPRLLIQGRLPTSLPHPPHYTNRHDALEHGTYASDDLLHSWSTPTRSSLFGGVNTIAAHNPKPQLRLFEQIAISRHLELFLQCALLL